jgi:hypothetical protein
MPRELPESQSVLQLSLRACERSVIRVVSWRSALHLSCQFVTMCGISTSKPKASWSEAQSMMHLKTDKVSRLSPHGLLIGAGNVVDPVNCAAVPKKRRNVVQSSVDKC